MQWDVIIHPCHKLFGCLVKRLLNVVYASEVTYDKSYGCDYQTIFRCCLIFYNKMGSTDMGLMLFRLYWQWVACLINLKASDNITAVATMRKKLRPNFKSLSACSHNELEYRIKLQNLLMEAVNSSPHGHNSIISQTTFSDAFLVNKDMCLLIEISLRCVAKSPTDHNPAIA